MNFTHLLTDAENAEVNSKYHKIQKAISRGIITQQEGQFYYIDYLVATFKEKACTIYCNSQAFEAVTL